MRQSPNCRNGEEMTDIKKMAIGLIQDHSCQYLKFNNTADEIQAMAIEFFEAGAEAYKKSLLEVGVQGATKIYAPHINYKGIYGLRDLSKVTDKPYSQDVEQTVFIEALPALARIAELEESNRLLKIANERTVSAAYHALLEMSAWLGINQSKRISHVDNLMENVKFCADEKNQKQIIEMQKESER